MTTALRAAAALAAALTAAACGGGDQPAVAVAAAVAPPTATATAQPAAAAPAIEAHLRKLYAGYTADVPPSIFDPETADAWLSPEFAGLVKAAHARTTGTTWPLDADPVIQAQDWGQLAVIAVDTVDTGPTTATSKVRFNSFGSENTTTFMMAKAGDRWLIDDIQRPEYEEKSLKAAFRTAAPPG